jgi:gluconate 2-dehydrogenase gamma chain
LAPAAPAEAQHPPLSPPEVDTEPVLTLTATEHAFFVAAADTIIPADELSPSGGQCGVATFIDRQLAGAYGFKGRTIDKPWELASALELHIVGE